MLSGASTSATTDTGSIQAGIIVGDRRSDNQVVTTPIVAVNLVIVFLSTAAALWSQIGMTLARVARVKWENMGPDSFPHAGFSSFGR